MPLVVTAHLFCRSPLKERLATTNFIHDAAQIAAHELVKLNFLGTKPGIAEKPIGRYPGSFIVDLNTATLWTRSRFALKYARMARTCYETGWEAHTRKALPWVTGSGLAVWLGSGPAAVCPITTLALCREPPLDAASESGMACPRAVNAATTWTTLSYQHLGIAFSSPNRGPRLAVSNASYIVSPRSAITSVEQLAEKRTVLLFYKEFESDKYIVGDRYLKRILRPIYNKIHGRQKITGFAVSFGLLCKALRLQGCDVRINEYGLAAKFPTYPVGIVGFPVILDGWKLKNPALLGPSLYDHPGLKPDLFSTESFKKYLVLADWMYDIFHPYYGDRCIKWFAGIDTGKWEDTSLFRKDFDFLIYDKIRWDKEIVRPRMLHPICAKLDARGLSYKILTYKYHDHTAYKEALSRARAMIFLTEHETQGLAYQEALSSGVPILAWDNGFWIDPLWKKFCSSPPAASSVPFFSPDCGAKFEGLEDFDRALDSFMLNLCTFKPRSFIDTEVNFSNSARIYLEAYFSLISWS